MTRPELLAADHIRELTQHHTTTEKRPRRVPVPTTIGPRHHTAWTNDPSGNTELHVVTHPPLLAQLRDAITGSTALSDESAGTRFGSKPAGHLESLDLVARIDRQSTDLANEHGIDQPDLTKRLLALSGFIGHHPHRLVRSWWASARVITQHDAPPYRPHAPCPACDEPDTLRIRVDDELGHCTSCGETWDTTGQPDSRPLALLAQHIRWCTDHEVTRPRHWLTDAGGYPVECTECLEFREARATRRAAQGQAVARGA
ncbi:DUF7341 domain-containing protein [Serinicoccus sediminis]|uniref:DUF7341 domain-containing protein n=1 Tax=Serinicoccus sediminis TaxID=2306021 RepID=UPI0010229A7D|nr:hypothetical protein [Serinicoccus sediminis]